MKYPGYETMGEIDLKSAGLRSGDLTLNLYDKNRDQYRLEIFQFMLGNDSEAKFNMRRRVHDLVHDPKNDTRFVHLEEEHLYDLVLRDMRLTKITSGAPLLNFGKVG